MANLLPLAPAIQQLVGAVKDYRAAIDRYDQKPTKNALALVQRAYSKLSEAHWEFEQAAKE